MPSFHIHLAISNKFAEKNVIADRAAFFRGTMDPDMVGDKAISHYTLSDDHSNLCRYLKQKVCLREYLRRNNIDSDYQKAVFLHLVTDYLFFTRFFDQEYIQKISYQDFVRDLYYSYNATNDYLIKKYNLNFGEYEKKIAENIEFYRSKRKVDGAEQRTNILPYDRLDTFIEKISAIDLQEYKDSVELMSE